MRAVQRGVLAMLMVSMLVSSIEAKAALPHVYNKIKNMPDFSLITFALTVAGSSSSFPKDLTSDTTLLAPSDKVRAIGWRALQLGSHAPPHRTRRVDHGMRLCLFILLILLFRVSLPLISDVCVYDDTSCCTAASYPVQQGPPS
jgi:hypothetical protein